MTGAVRLLGACLIVIGAVAVAAGHSVYRARITTPLPTDVRTRFETWYGLTGAEATRAAREQVRAGLATLHDTSAPGPERVRAYRERLRAAESLLIQALRAEPARADALVQLAAARWELDPGLIAHDAEQLLGMIDLASRLSPGLPRVQEQLGELMLKIGRPVKAADYLGRAVELDPQRAGEAVLLLRDHGASAAEIAAALPPNPATLVALAAPFFDEGLARNYLELTTAAMERADGEPDRLTLRAHARACLAADEPQRLVDELSELGPLADEATESERRLQRATARLALHDAGGAAVDAAAALVAGRDDNAVAEAAGDLFVRTGDASRALEAYGAALVALAVRPAGAPHRARVHRKIGQAEELRGETARAYDAYRRALRVDPAEPFAARRVAELEGRAPPR